MGASLNLRRTSIALTFAPCCGFAQGFEPLTLAGEPPLQAQIPDGAGKRGVHVGGNAIAHGASLAELDRFLARYLQSK